MLSNRALRYILVGGSLTLAYTLATALLIQTGVCGTPTLASAVASLGLIPFSYVAHRTWTSAWTPLEPFCWPSTPRLARQCANSCPTTSGTHR